MSRKDYVVRCNYCLVALKEGEIIYKEDTYEEYCPHCGGEGKLMNIRNENGELLIPDENELLTIYKEDNK